MKKLRTTLVVCLTALAVLTAFGCKQEGDFSEPSKDWKYQTALNEPESKGTIQVVIDKNGPIEWAVVVDEYNRVVKSAPDGTVDGDNLAKASVAVGRAIQFKGLETGKEYTVYVYQPGVEVKVGDKKGTAKDLGRDLRGTVKLQKEKGVSVKISNYGEHVPSAGLVTITNNEPVAGSKWTGNYGISSIKAVRNDGTKDSPKWVEVSGYTVTAKSGYLINDKNNTTSGSNSREILFPAGDYHIAVNQPNRVGTTGDDIIKQHIQDNWANKGNKFPGQLEGEATSPENIEAYKKYQSEAWWITANTTQNIQAHTATTTLSTSSLNGYLSGTKTADGGRYAAPAVYEIVEAPAGER